MNPNITYTPLTRTQDNHLIAGVCSGIAKVFNIDPAWIRIAFLISLLVFKLTVVVYLILWIYLPRETKHHPQTATHTQALPNPDQQETPALIAPAIPPVLEDIDNPLPPLAELLQERTVDTSHHKTATQQPIHSSTPTTNSPEIQDFLAAFEDDMTSTPNDKPTQQTQTTAFEEFPSDFLASFDDETNSTQDNVTPISEALDKPTSFEEFPSDFLASFDDETNSTQDNVTPISEVSDKPTSFEEFPSDFLASFDDETTHSQDNVTPISDALDKSTSFDEFPSDFLASFDDETNSAQDNITPTPDKLDKPTSFEEFPADFLESFKDEED